MRLWPDITQKKLLDSAVDAALAALWTALAGVAVSIILFAWGVFWGLSGDWLNRLLGATVGGTFIAIMAVIAVVIRNRRLVRAERLRQALYASDQKGYLDHYLIKEQAAEEFGRNLVALTRVLVRVGKRLLVVAQKVQAASLQPATAAKRGHAYASKMAKMLHSASARVEPMVAACDHSVDLLVESQVAFMVWAIQAGMTPDTLLKLRLEAEQLKGHLANTPVAAAQMAASFSGLQGITSELDGAHARFLATINATVAAVQKVDSLCDQMIDIIDQASQGIAVPMPQLQ